MPEQDVNVAELFPDAKLDGEDDVAPPTTGADGESTPAQADGNEKTVNADEVAEQIDKQLKKALMENLERPAMACFMVDLLSPGMAMAQMRATGKMGNLSPTQHFFLAAFLIFGVAVATNPQLRQGIQGAFKRNDPAKQARKLTTKEKGIDAMAKFQPDGDDLE